MTTSTIAGNVLKILFGLYGALMIIILVTGVLIRPNYSGESVELFGRPFLQQAVDYNQVKLLAGILGRIVRISLVFLFFWLIRSSNFGILKSILFLTLLLVATYILTFPLSYWSGFLVERDYGLSTQSFGNWFLDYGKSVMVSFLISWVAYSGLYFLITRFPRNWWLIVWAVVVLFSLVGTILYPLIIDPLFYNFKPLQDQGMVASIKEMGHKAGINIDRVLVADASRRTVKANAYFAGLGGTQRIVIYDNLLNNFSSRQVLAVIAHEMGHWKNRHLFIWFFISIPASLVFVLAAFWLSMRLGGSALTRVMVVILTYILLSTLVLPIQNIISRTFERQADQAAIELSQDPWAVRTLFINIAKTNYSLVEPHPWIKYLWYSHPPLMERIKTAGSAY